MKSQLFKHIATSVKAIRFTGENHKEVGSFLHWPESRDGVVGSNIEVDPRLRLYAMPGEYVLCTEDGVLSVMPDSQFTDNFRPVDPTEALPGVLLEDYIANPSIIWYGPHECSVCGETIIRAELEQGGVKLDAPHQHHYPNHEWALHNCRGYRVPAEGPRDGEALMEVQRKCPFPPIPTSSTPPAVVAAGQNDPKVLAVPVGEDDLPGALALAKGVAEQRWPHTMDAQVWADEWLKTIGDKPGIPTDRETMVGWFANAIMAGYDTAGLRSSSEAVTA